MRVRKCEKGLKGETHRTGGEADMGKEREEDRQRGCMETDCVFVCVGRWSGERGMGLGEVRNKLHVITMCKADPLACKTSSKPSKREKRREAKICKMRPEAITIVKRGEKKS